MQNTRKHREIITINVGGCGVNLGQSTLEQYCAEQGISADGSKEHKTNFDDSVHISFEEQSSGKYKARALFVDLDPTSMVMTKALYTHRDVLYPNYCLSGYESADKNFARGHYTVGKELIDKVSDRLRLAVEECDWVQGFIINHSMHGGTGGGLGALIMERLAVDYRKRDRFDFHVLPGFGRDSSTMSTYNTVFSLHWMLDHIDASFMLDNEAIQSHCMRKLNIKVPRYKHYNYLCNKVISGITAPFRFGMNTNLGNFVRNMVQFPRLHFLNCSLSPIVRKSKEQQMVFEEDIASLTDQCVKSENFFMHVPDFDEEEDKYTAFTFNYRSEMVQECRLDINRALTGLKRHSKVFSLDRCGLYAPCVQYIEGAPVEMPNDDMASGRAQCVMIGNNSMFPRIIEDRVIKKFDLLYSQRSAVHWYVGEGMDEREFAEAREDFRFLYKDYLDILTEM